MKTNGDGQLLASRACASAKRDRQAGHRRQDPVPVTSFNSSQTVGGNIVPVTSFQYLDVGIKIEIKPRVHHNKEISLSLKIEVSNQNGSVDAGNGQQQPIIGTRNIESVIRLKDGETNFLAGLIRSEETGSKSGIAGLSEIPVLGNIFSNTTRHKSRTDLILTLTPHIIRTPDITAEDLLPVSVGTESNLTFRGSSPRIESDNEGPFDDDSQTPDVREMLRRRMEELPPTPQQRQLGGQDVDPNAEKPAVKPPDLATGKGPSDFFAPTPPPPPPQPPADQTPPPNNGPAAYRSSSAQALDTASGSSPSSGIVLASNADSGAKTQTAAPTVVHLRMENSPAEVGEEFEVGIEADALRPVSHLPIALQFDPARVEVLRVEGGAFLGTAGQSQVLADFSRPGELLLGASRLGQLPGVTGKGEVARVTFRALAPGRTALTWTVVRALDERLKDVGTVDAAAFAVIVRAKAHGPRGGNEAPKVQASEPPNGR